MTVADSEDQPASRTDAELTALLREENDDGALEEIYRRHRAAVLSYARTCCRDPHTAEDLVSEAFARTIRVVRSGGGPEAAWRPYLLVVVRRTAADWAASSRRTALSAEFEQWFEEHTDASEGEDGEERVLRLEEHSLVLRGFRSLPERWQAVLWHTVVEDESPARTGARLGISASAVTSLAARAREGLREAYLTAHVQSGDATAECGHYRSLLAAAVRRSGWRGSRDLARHLSACARCRRAATELADLNSRLRTALPAGVLLWGAQAYVVARMAGADAATAALASRADGDGAGQRGLWTRARGVAITTSCLLFGALWLSPPSAPDRTLLAPKADRSLVPTDTSSPPPEADSTAGSAPVTSRPPRRTADGPTPKKSTRSMDRAASPSSSSSSSSMGKRSRLVVATTRRCVEVQGETSTPREAYCVGSTRQQWELVPVKNTSGDGRTHLQLRNAYTRRCLTHTGTTKPEDPVWQRPCNSSDSQQTWVMEVDQDRGLVSFRSRNASAWLGLNDAEGAAAEAQHNPYLGTSSDEKDQYDELWADFLCGDIQFYQD
ncbi:sigma-70 family RNA polymerase sigma factor [Streptomyces sp. NPDC050658]|uniref:sigma-70 family RNA polymerase sigma factor n=1 Tax=unclassified Streptomyces TaxID=2593676 RepID=UPI003418C00F